MGRHQSRLLLLLLPKPHRLLDGAVILADVVNDARDAERTGEAQQVGQEAEGDAEDERSAERPPQGLPDGRRARRCRDLRPLSSEDGRRRRRQAHCSCFSGLDKQT